jgi:hypothetical protein
MMTQISSEINQVTKRRPRLVVYLKTETGPSPEDFANLNDGDIAQLERRWGRAIFASQAELGGDFMLLSMTAEKLIQQKKEREMPWEPGQELPGKPDEEMPELVSKPFNEQTKDVVLKFRDVLRQAWGGDQAALGTIRLLGQASANLALTKHGQIELIVNDLLGMTCILFLRDFGAGRLGLCANPQCPSPFFVRSRRTQKFCGLAACMVLSHQVSANKYWNRHREKVLAKSKKGLKKR